jgi:hypothetical protein
MQDSCPTIKTNSFWEYKNYVSELIIEIKEKSVNQFYIMHFFIFIFRPLAQEKEIQVKNEAQSKQ